MWLVISPMAPPTPVGLTSAAIAARGLRFRYAPEARPAVDGVDLTVAPGEIVGLLGPSGAGKSTTQRILTGRLSGWAGDADVLGRDLRSWAATDNASIGVSFEHPAGFAKLTGRENLRFFAGLYERAGWEVDELIDALGLADAADRRLGTYSKGMRVRLDLARALVHRPPVLFLDEPTGGLDPVSAARVRSLIRGEADRGAAVLLTTHDMVTAEAIADRVALVVDGRIVAAGAPHDLALSQGRPRVRVVHRGLDGERRSEEFALDGLAEAPGFLALLRSGRVETIHTTEPTLADVFVSLTGRTLR